MGLNQYAYVANDIKNIDDDQEFAYWRKHNRLQGWMENLWKTYGNEDVFNGQHLILTESDIDALQKDIENMNLPKTSGFFFGTDSYEYPSPGVPYSDYSTDMKFIENARKYLKEGKTIYYQCSW